MQLFTEIQGVSPGLTMTRSGNQVTVDLTYFLSGYLDEETMLYNFNGDAYSAIGTVERYVSQAGDGDPGLFINHAATLVAGVAYDGQFTVRDYDMWFELEQAYRVILFDTASSYTGNGGMDVIFGSALDDTLSGGDGTDAIEGGAGNDTLYGGAGNDTISLGDGNDFTGGGEGNDLIYGDSGTNRIWGGLGADTVYGGTGAEEIYGGGTDRNQLYGNDGADLMVAGTGGDTLDGGAGNDTLYGSTGHDTIHLGTGNDFVGGGAGNDVIYADTGSNRIYGGIGNDTIHSGTGRDVLTGSLDSDVFVFASVATLGIAATRDIITDFAVGVDDIDLRGLGLSFTAAGFFAGGGLRQVRSIAGFVVGDANGDGVADFSIEMTGGVTVQAGDFLL